ncbi:acyltransferase family protein [Nocardia vermiculata]|uniref:Acyltransferase n=1 Tax=Nocardia vermiculata TaxID=257274 RepID=A0A846Y484_9NOCA|nr:acyltransferase family protein [Nocardia vermiculata]NKY52664.1 acyltransferase [Nocardia vermiculata]
MPGAVTDTATDQSRPVTYRKDLDGLRGLAIALVVVFHLWCGRVSGGVDIFLVLSGYFFTGSLLRRATSGGPVGIGTTLRRTARRLLPALVTVLAAVVVGTVLLRPYTQWSDLAGQTLASLLYYQNWQLATTWSDYLAADPSVSPLQHLWSMSVQGQYYVAALLVVAATVWICRRAGRDSAIRPALATVIGVGIVASFLYATHGLATHQGWNYYDSAARAWELLIGAALALAATALRVPRPVRVVLAAAGLLVVFVGGWITDGASQFPGPPALLPVGAAVALIVAGAGVSAQEQPWLTRVLASDPLVRLGDIAYSLYLWHWPLLIFLLSERGGSHVGLRGGLAVIAASMVLAYLTHRYIEEPLRLSRPRPSDTGPAFGPRYRRTAGVALSLTAVLVAGSAVAWSAVMHTHPPRAVGALDPTQYPGAEALASGAPVPQARMRPTVYEAPAELPPPTVDGCIADWNNRDVVTCTYGVPDAERTLAVVGNSHAEHWMPALQQLAEQYRFKILVHLKMGCPLTLDPNAMYKGEPNADCRDWTLGVLDVLGKERPDWVFTTATRPIDAGGDETPQDYVDVWKALSDEGMRVVAVRDTPWLRHHGVRYKAADCLAERGNRTSCGIRRSDALSPVNPALAPAAAFPNIFPIDLTDAVCEPDICPVEVGNILVYHDEHHFTASYSRSLGPELGRQLGPVLEWW